MRHLILPLLLLSLSAPVPAAFAGPPPETVASWRVRSVQLNEEGVRALNQHNVEAAEALFRGAIDLDSSNSVAALNLAGVLLAENRAKQSLPLLREHAAKRPGDASFQAALGDAYCSTKRLGEAARHYRRALAIQPSYPGIAAKLGTIYSTQRQAAKAVEMYEAAVALNPRDWQSLANLSALYLAQGKPLLAVESAQRSVRLNPRPDTWVALAAAYQKAGDPANALLSFKRATDLGNDDPKVAAAVRLLEAKAQAKERS